MTDPPVQGFSRFIAIDIHKHYLMIGGIDAQQQIVLQPRNVELHRWLDWAKANLHPSDSASTRSTTERGQDALGHHRLEHEKQERTEKQGAVQAGRHDAAVQGRRRSRGSDGGLNSH